MSEPLSQRQIGIIKGVVEPEDNDEWNWQQDHANDLLPKDSTQEEKEEDGKEVKIEPAQSNLGKRPDALRPRTGIDDDAIEDWMDRFN